MGARRNFSRGGQNRGLTKMTYFWCAKGANENFRDFFGDLDSIQGCLMRAPRAQAKILGIFHVNSIWRHQFQIPGGGQLPQVVPPLRAPMTRICKH